MTIKAVQSNQIDKNNCVKNNSIRSNTPSFSGVGNPVITLMDAIDRGGFAASFIAQDGIGMVAPRVHEGLNRNRKQTGEYNWEFARKEGIREVLSGPSAFIIPSGIIALVKKFSGTANNVPVDFIDTYGDLFARYASANKSSLQNAAKAKSEFYESVFKNVLKTSLEQKLPEDEVNKLAKHFTEKAIEIEKAKSKGFFNVLFGKEVKGSAQDLTQELADEFMELRKSNVGANTDFLSASVKSETKNKTVSNNFKRIIKTLRDYTNDVLDKTAKPITEASDTKGIESIVKNFNMKRMGTRIATNFSMFGAVVAFYTIIPKLYSLGLKSNPGLKGLQEKEEVSDDKSKQPSFTGGFSKTAELVNGSNFLKKISNSFEFSDATMPVSAMLTLLFGFCLPPRYLNAKDKKTGKPDVYDRKEILVRDVSSFTAILFGAKALSRAFSGIFAKTSGLALNITPENHNKSIFHKLKNYFTAGSGINVLNSEEIVSKYSHIDKYEEGINGFFKFVKSNGGDLKKILSLNPEVKNNAEKILGKSVKDATIDEIEKTFKNVSKDNVNLKKIYQVFADSNNAYVKRAKTLNSAFGFASTLVLVPAFMIWLARYCERMTKNAIAKDRAKNAVHNDNFQPSTNKISMTSSNVSMENFLASK